MSDRNHASSELPGPVTEQAGEKHDRLFGLNRMRAVALGAVALLAVTTAGYVAVRQGDTVTRSGAAVTAPATTSPETAGAVPEAGEFAATPTWEQDFTRQSQLDTSVWQYDLNPEVPTWNKELQGYTNRPQNVRVEQGTGLVIEARREQYQYPDDPSRRNWDYTSGRIQTGQGYTVGLGRIEATMKLPEGKGVWPAFWLLSANQPYTKALRPTDKDWQQDRFYMHDGELDIMEYYGNQPGAIDLTAHTYNKSYEGSAQVPDATAGFHTYGVDIFENRMVWRIDGKAVRTVVAPSGNPDDWPFKAGNDFKVLLNLALGGNAGSPDASRNDWQLVVKDVRYYAMQGR